MRCDRVILRHSRCGKIMLARRPYRNKVDRADYFSETTITLRRTTMVWNRIKASRNSRRVYEAKEASSVPLPLNLVLFPFVAAAALFAVRYLPTPDLPHYPSADAALPSSAISGGKQPNKTSDDLIPPSPFAANPAPSPDIMGAEHLRPGASTSLPVSPGMRAPDDGKPYLMQQPTEGGVAPSALITSDHREYLYRAIFNGGASEDRSDNRGAGFVGVLPLANDTLISAPAVASSPAAATPLSDAASSLAATALTLVTQIREQQGDRRDRHFTAVAAALTKQTSPTAAFTAPSSHLLTRENGVNLINNGSFENALTGWVTGGTNYPSAYQKGTSGTGLAASPLTNTQYGQPDGGSYCGLMYNDTGQGYIAQSVSLIAGTTYTLAFDDRGVGQNNAYNSLFDVFFTASPPPGDSSVNLLTTVASVGFTTIYQTTPTVSNPNPLNGEPLNWTTVDEPFLATQSGTYYLTFLLQGGGIGASDTNFDRVALTASSSTPEPASLALLFRLGLLSLFLPAFYARRQTAAGNEARRSIVVLS